MGLILGYFCFTSLISWLILYAFISACVILPSWFVSIFVKLDKTVSKITVVDANGTKVYDSWNPLGWNY